MIQMSMDKRDQGCSSLLENPVCSKPDLKGSSEAELGQNRKNNYTETLNHTEN